MYVCILLSAGLSLSKIRLRGIKSKTEKRPTEVPVPKPIDQQTDGKRDILLTTGTYHCNELNFFGPVYNNSSLQCMR